MNQYCIDNRPYTFTTPLAAELAIDLNKSYLCPLEHLTCLSVLGDHAEKFLQGQLSCDVSKVDAQHFVSGALCNLQGRVKLLVDVLCCHDYQLVLPKDLVDTAIADLKTAAMLSRVTLHHSPNYRVFAIVGNIQDDFIPADYRLPQGQALKADTRSCVYTLCDSVLMVLVHQQDAASLLDYYQQQQQVKGSLLFHYYALQNKKFTIYPVSSGQFLPHKISLHDLGYLSFDKGCYKGQEIIARMHYRGTIKHQLQVWEWDTEVQPMPGQALVNDQGQNIGEIIDYCPLGDSRYYIAASVLIQHEGPITLA
ncbi:MAG: hypothetical protein JJT82_08000 [Legionellaceae bacterium]|nr:hypothetical protein [Legionellaceae bacterium]